MQDCLVQRNEASGPVASIPWVGATPVPATYTDITHQYRQDQEAMFNYEPYLLWASGMLPGHVMGPCKFEWPFHCVLSLWHLILLICCASDQCTVYNILIISKENLCWATQFVLLRVPGGSSHCCYNTRCHHFGGPLCTFEPLCTFGPKMPDMMAENCFFFTLRAATRCPLFILQAAINCP